MEEKNKLKYNIKNKNKRLSRELKRGACEINCREVVFWSNNFWSKLISFNFMHSKKSTFFKRYFIDI